MILVGSSAQLSVCSMSVISRTNYILSSLHYTITQSANGYRPSTDITLTGTGGNHFTAIILKNISLSVP